MNLAPEAQSRPIVRYHGGKWRLAPWIVQHMAPHRIYVEPFGGGASVLLRKPRSYAEIYGDIDGELVNLFRILRDPIAAAALAALVSFTPYAREEFEESYEPTDDPIERARRTLIRSHMGFSGGAGCAWRTGFRVRLHKNRGSHVARDWATLPPVIADTCRRLEGVVIECRDGRELMRSHDHADTLHYVDPPYLPETRRGGRYRQEPDERGHIRLAACIRKLRGQVLLSGYASELYDELLFPDWHRVERAHRADKGQPRTEVLWSNRPFNLAMLPLT